jgi:hypothetical protein
MQFAGMEGTMTFDLRGNFLRDIRGSLVRLRGPGQADAEYMEGFSETQTGRVGDMTAGLPPHDYGKDIYFEWYGDDNGRVVLELAPGSVEVLTPPIPWIESDPRSPAQSHQQLHEYMEELGEIFGSGPDNESRSQ